MPASTLVVASVSGMSSHTSIRQAMLGTRAHDWPRPRKAMPKATPDKLGLGSAQASKGDGARRRKPKEMAARPSTMTYRVPSLSRLLAMPTAGTMAEYMTDTTA